MIFDRIRDLIYPDPSILINIQQLQSGDAELVLEENDPGATLKEVKLRGFEYSNTMERKYLFIKFTT